ncbi:MAG: LamG domain-containing protein [Pseudomonadota bacterium]
MGDALALQVNGTTALDIEDVVLDGAFTIEAWVNLSTFDPADNRDGIVRNDGGPGQDINFFAGQARLFATGPGNNDRLVANFVATPGEWAHYAFTRADDGTLKVYVNGVLDNTGALPFTDPFEITELGGARAGVSNGLFDNVRIWDVERSAGEIAASFDQNLPGDSAGLLRSFGFDGDGNTIVDETGNSAPIALPSGLDLVTSTAPIEGASGGGGDDAGITLTLVDAKADAAVVEIEDGDVVSLDDLDAGARTLSVEVADEDFDGSVKLKLYRLEDGEETLVNARTENVEPYALFGDNTRGDFFKGEGFGAGEYRLDLFLFEEDRGRGDLVASESVGFTIEGPALEDFLSLSFVDTASDAVIGDLPVTGDNLVFDAAGTDAEDLGLFVSVDEAADVESVRLTLRDLEDGSVVNRRVENVDPYALFGDNTKGNFFGGDGIEEGAYALELEFFARNGARDEIGSVEVEFDLVFDFA